MAQIFGKYQHERDENMEEFKHIWGEVYFDLMGMSNFGFVITQDDGFWIIFDDAMGRNHVALFELGGEYFERMPSGRKLQGSTRRNGDYLFIRYKTEDYNAIIMEYKFTKDGIIFTMQVSKQPEPVIRRYFKRVNMVQTSPPRSKKSLMKKVGMGLGIGLGAVVCGGLAIAAAPLVVAAAGFTSGGIVAGTTAASMMSVLGGGATSAGGVVATLQSVGALGTVLGSTAATATAAGTGAAIGAAATAGTGAAIGAAVAAREKRAAVAARETRAAIAAAGTGAGTEAAMGAEIANPNHDNYSKEK